MSFYEIAKEEMQEIEKEIERTLANEPKEVYGMLLEYIKRGGKRIRPLLAILCNKVCNGDPKKIIKAAAIIELFHNFTLIHDDICDNSEFRRGKPTLHIEYGLPIALNSGDALYTLIWQKITHLDLEPAKLQEVQKMYALTFKKVVEGQGRELDWHQNNKFSISESEYISMIDGKTTELMAFSCELGAFLANSSQKEREALKTYGQNIGKAFQIQDDILNVTGNFEKYKKEIGGDITEGKRTLMVIYTLEKTTNDESKRLKEILQSRKAGEKEIRYVIELFKKYGSIERADKKARDLIESAKKNLDVLNTSHAKQVLIDLTNYMTSREN
ncbi:MAG: polyprenyl synthetase family protein [Candidatus Micrarchaeota archaeon]